MYICMYKIVSKDKIYLFHIGDNDGNNEVGNGHTNKQDKAEKQKLDHSVAAFNIFN